jgi:hypothetical protein
MDGAIAIIPPFDPMKAFQEAYQEVIAHKNLIRQEIPSPDAQLVQLKASGGGSAFGSGAPKSLGANAPSQAYLQTKRTSVFSKPYQESVQEILEYFTPPKYEKTQKEIDRIIKVL